MSNFYHDYTWKNGIPYGLGKSTEEAPVHAYKIAMDPYRKRIAIEKWDFGKFVHVIYDSGLLDFRHLQPAEQTAWQKVITREDSEAVISEIRNQDDRTVLIENYQFENGFCRQCQIFSAHRVLVAEQRLYYRALGDEFNGVILMDIAGKAVMYKLYACDNDSGEFADLVEEQWDMQKSALPLEKGRLCPK